MRHRTVFLFWAGRKVLSLTVLLTMNEAPDKNHRVKYNQSEKSVPSKSGILFELISLTPAHFTKVFSLYFISTQAYCWTVAGYVVCSSGKDSKFILNTDPTEALLYTEKTASHSSQKKQHWNNYLCVHFSPQSPEILLLQSQQWCSLPWFTYSEGWSPSLTVSVEAVSWRNPFTIRQELIRAGTVKSEA